MLTMIIFEISAWSDAASQTLLNVHDASKGNIEGYKVLRDIVFFEII